MSLECASSCPLDDDEIRKLVDLIIPRLSKHPHWTEHISSDSIRQTFFYALKAVLLRIPHNAYALVPEENRCENLLRPHSPFFPGWMLHEQILYAVGALQENDRNGSSITDVSDEERSGSIVGGGLFTIAPIANHSCDANLSHELTQGNYMIFRTNRDIEAGEELCDNYGPRYGVDLYSVRRETLQKRYEFKCECEACCSGNKNSEMDSVLNGMNCANCHNRITIENQESAKAIQCSKCRESQPQASIRDFSRLQPDYWVEKELDEFYGFFNDSKTLFSVGNLLFEQLTHLLAYNCVLELQFEKAEDCLNYIKKSIEKRVGKRSIEYANLLLAHAALCYVWNLWLQQEEARVSKKYADQVEVYLKLAEKLYHAHVSKGSSRYEMIEWIRKRNEEIRKA